MTGMLPPFRRRHLDIFQLKRLLQKFPEDTRRLKTTLAAHDRESVRAALNAAITLYEDLTAKLLPAGAPLRRSVRAYKDCVS